MTIAIGMMALQPIKERLMMRLAQTAVTILINGQGIQYGVQEISC